MKNVSISPRKDLSAAGLLKTVRTCFEKISDHRSTTKEKTFSLPDTLMSGVAVFGMKCSSLLNFDKLGRFDRYTKHNLKTLYGVEQPPSDTRMREILDPVDPRSIRRAFKSVFATLQRGKVLEQFQFLNGAVLVSLDGTGYFSSNEVHCENCCVKKRKDGTITYYHQMLGAVVVHPDLPTVIPLAPEPIIKQDGAKKNDCERNAAKRFLTDFRREHPHLKTVIVEDSLASNAPHIKLLRELKFGFILGVKPGDHEVLFSHIEDVVDFRASGEMEIVDEKTKITHKFRYFNGAPLNGNEDHELINFLEYWEIRGEKTTHFSWVTSMPLSKTNVYDIMRGGRARWKIENETFNTLKNQGYEFEHNFGHGNQNLSVNFAMLMMLAFLIDQVQELACKLFQAAKLARGSKKYLWEKMRGMFTHFPFESWTDFYRAIAHGFSLLEFKINST